MGRAIRTLGDAAQSMADARVALEHAWDNGVPIARFDDLDPASWLLASCDQEVASQKIVEVLDRARPTRFLLETLRTYFAVNMNVAEAALRLNVHRNTLRYRLARIEEVLGMPLDAPETIANLHLALRPNGSPATPGTRCWPTDRLDARREPKAPAAPSSGPAEPTGHRATPCEAPASTPGSPDNRPRRAGEASA